MFETEVFNRHEPWKSKDQVEWETLQWVHWHNNTRLHGAIGYITPQEAEKNYEQALKSGKIAA